MALEHLSDDEYEAFKRQGLAGLDDMAYERLKLPTGVGHPALGMQKDQLNAQLQAAKAGMGGLETASAGIQPQISEIAKIPGQLSEAGSALAAKVPGMTQIGQAGQAVAKAGDVVDQVVNAARPGTLTFGTMGAGEAARASIPQGPGSALLQALPLAGEAFGAMMPAARVAGQAAPLAEGAAAENLASAGKAATGVGENVFQRVAGDIGRLNRPSALKEAMGTESAQEAAGQVMNQVASKLGVKTGTDALMHIPEYAKTGQLGAAKPFADTVAEALPKAQELEQLKAQAAELAKSPSLSAEDTAKLGELRQGLKMGKAFGPTKASGMVFGEMSPTAEAAHATAQLSPEQFLSPEVSGAMQKIVPPEAEAGTNPTKGLAEYLEGQIKQQSDLSAQKAKIAARIKELEAPVQKGGAPTLQDVVSARQVTSTDLARPKYLADPAQMDKDYAVRRLKALDEAMDTMSKGKTVEPVDVPGYGKVSSLADARKVYSEAMDHDALDQWAPVNKNGTPSVVRMLAAFYQGMASPLKGVATAAASSPKAWAAGMKGVESARGALAGLGEAAQAATPAAAATGPLTNVGQEMSREKK